MKRLTGCHGSLLLAWLLLLPVRTNAQMPNFYGGSAAPQSAPAATPAPKESGQPVPAETTGKSATGGTASPRQPAQASGNASASLQPRNFSVPLYDPNMDNHLKVPDKGEVIGLFGRPIGEVEEYLRFLGAKKHSYAFGKYSRMTLSVYLVTLFFDRDRRLGGFSVEPRPPYRVIGAEARKFFLDIMIGKADLSRFSTIIAADRLELKYAPVSVSGL
jgi:hypothetical protein